LLSLACPDVQYFSTFSYKGHDSKEKRINIKCTFFIFCTTFDPNISNSQNNSARCDHTCILVFMYSTCCSCQILIKLEFSQQFSEKYSNVKLNEILSSRVVPRGRTDGSTDGQRDMTKLIVAFRNFVKAPKSNNFNFILFISRISRFECE